MSDEDPLTPVERLRYIFAHHPRFPADFEVGDQPARKEASRAIRLQGTNHIELWESEHKALEEAVFQRLAMITAGVDEMDPILKFTILFLMKSW